MLTGACGRHGINVVSALVLLAAAAAASAPREAHAQRSFLRGDANADSTVDISDPLYSLGYLFLGLSEPLCLDAADANDDGTVDISDASFTLGYLFLGSASPPAPGPDLAGPDPTADAQGCGPPLPSGTLLEPWSEPPAKARRNQEQDTQDIAKKTSLAESERSSHHTLGTCEWEDIVLTGQVRRRECDILVPGRGLDFAWVRTYRSSGGPDTAMGNGWDFSYNIWIEPLGGSPPDSVRLHDGGGRADELTRRDDGRYVAPEVLLEGQVAADGAFVITFSDRGTWRCHPLDGSPTAGKIAEIRDRTGNRLAFEYDDAGRLTRIVDTVNRTCDVAYDEAGMISSLNLKLWVDANGDGTISPADLKELEERSVRYEHISRASVSGSRGDLRRVSVPITPVNLPPVVRSHTYTYSTGAADEEANHNLLTVTDEAGRLQVRNVYAAVPALSHLHGEGVVHRDIAARSLAFSYSGGSGGAGGLLTIVRDGIGNVSEYLHDERNRLVRLREFTGRADPALPTTATENRPTGKLRLADPDYFETAFSYNDDSMLTRVTWPNGSSLVQEIEVPAAGASTLSRGNVLVRRHLAGPLGAEPAELVERFEYHPLFQRVTREVDARGNATTREYDDAGNLVRVVFPGLATGIDQGFDEHGQLASVTLPDNGSGHRPRLVYTYSDWNAIVLRVTRDTDSDGDGVPDTIVFSHDALGNVTREVDARGNVTESERNQIGELVGVKGPASSPGGVEHVFLWDAQRDLGGNVTRVVLRDGKDPGKLVLQFFEHDEWNRLVRRYRQAGDVTLPPGGLDELPSVPLDQLDQFVVSEYSYDAAGDLAREVLEGAGKQPDPLRNVTVAHDERRLPWRVVRGAGSAEETTEQFDYSLNGLLRISTKEPTKLEYPNLRLVHDGFDRPVSAFDAMGNEARLSYDPNGNVTRLVVLGELVDSDGDAANVELQRTDYFHDAMDRCVREVAFLESDPVPEAARAKREELHLWADCGRASRCVDANGNETSWEYDSAGRLASVIDAGGNAVRSEYDANDNLVRTTRVDREADGTVRETPWIHRYDALDRRVSTEDAEGNAATQDYDYRSLPVRLRDALGNVTERVHDALGRCVSSSRLLKDPDTGAVIEKLTRSQTWDASSRLLAETDENGNVTRYAYDALDRCVATTRADGTVASVVYDAFDGVTEATDPNGTHVVSGYDRLHRLTRNTIVAGPGVSSDTTFEEYAYDGLSRLIRASDDDSNVGFTYDLLSRVVRETLNGLETTYTHDLADNVLSIQTPGGHRTEYEYDALDRMRIARTVGAGQVTEILSRTFGGPDRLASLGYQNGVQSSFVHDPLLRPARSTHASPDAVGGLLPFDDRAYGYDAAYRKTSRQSLLPGGLAQTYDFDSADRLVRSTFGISGAPPNAISYFLDPAGDRKQVVGGPDAGPYVLDPTLPEPADRQMRQYTGTPDGARRYDQDGNLTSILAGGRVGRSLEYDFAGRLVRSEDPLTQTTVRHRYDALGRRWGHEMAKGIIQNIRARIFAGPNVVEERDESDHPVSFIDYAADGQPVRRACCADLDGDGAPDVVHFFHTDDAGNVTAVTDAQGQLAERYEYGDYGRPRILDAAGSPLPESAIGNPFLLAASWYDAETGYFVVGNDAPALSYEGRHYDPHTATEIGQRFAIWPHMHQHGTHQRWGAGRGGAMGAPKKSFGQKLGSFAKGVAQVGLGVVGGTNKKMMGAPKIGEATAVFNISQAGELLAWVETVWNKQCVEKDTIVRLANQDYQDIADDEIDSVSNPLSVGGKAQGQLGQKAKAWMVSNYEVHPVFGLKTEWITSIGLPKITPKLAKESHGKFRLPLLSSSGAGGLFAASGSSDKFQTTSPGHKSVGEITLRGAMTRERKALCTWINDTVMGKPWKRMLTITELLSVDGGVKDGKTVWREFSPAEEQLKENPRH